MRREATGRRGTCRRGRWRGGIGEESEGKGRRPTGSATDFDYAPVVRRRLGILFEVIVQLRKLLVNGCLLGVRAYQRALKAFDGFSQPTERTCRHPPSAHEETRGPVSIAADIMRRQGRRWKLAYLPISS